MKLLLTIAMAAAALVLGSCDQHNWEDTVDENGNVTQKGTKRLFEAHGAEEGKDQDGEAAH